MLDIDTIKNYKYNISFRINLHEEFVNYKKDSTTIIFSTKNIQITLY